MNRYSYNVNGRSYTKNEIADKTGWNRLKNLWHLSQPELQLREDMLRAVIRDDGADVNTNHVRCLGLITAEQQRRASAHREIQRDNQSAQAVALLSRIADQLDTLSSGAADASDTLSAIRDSISSIESTFGTTDEEIADALRRIKSHLRRY
jgi:chromosome segregation ATPase